MGFDTVEINLVISQLQFSHLTFQGNVSLAQLESLSLALPAKLVNIFKYPGHKLLTISCRSESSNYKLGHFNLAEVSPSLTFF